MAGKKTIALFDVDGTLTVPRKVRCGLLSEAETGPRRLRVAHPSWAPHAKRRAPLRRADTAR
jgi:hypothetical protein